MTKKQKVLLVGIIDLFIMICGIAALALQGTIYYIIESILLVSWLITSSYISKGCKELANNKDNIDDNKYESKVNTLAKYIILASFIFAVILTIIILISLR